MQRVICASGKLRKNEVRGSMKECAERGKVMYWGLNKVDPKILEFAKNEKKNRMTIQKARLKMIALKANIGAIERKIDDIKHRSKEKRKETDVSEIEQLQKQLSEKIKDYNESVKLIKQIEKQTKEKKEEQIVKPKKKEKDKEELSDIKIFDNMIPNDNKIIKPIEKKKIINNLNDIENMMNRFIKKGSEVPYVLYHPNKILQNIVSHVIMYKYNNTCPLQQFIYINPKNDEKLQKYKKYFELSQKGYAVIYGYKLSDEDIGMKNLLNNISTCIKQNQNTIIMHLSLPSHANLIIIKPYTKEIIHYEPNLHYEKINKSIPFAKNIIQKVLIPQLKKLTNIDFHYVETEDICPKEPVGLFNPQDKQGFQSIEIKYVPQDIEHESRGFCVLWSWFFGILLINNPNLTTTEVYKKAYEILGSNPQTFRNVIRGFYLEILEEITKLKNEFKKPEHKFLFDIYDDPISYFKNKKTITLPEEKKMNDILTKHFNKRIQQNEKEKGSGLRSMYKHKNINLGFIKKNSFKNIKCLCDNKKKATKHCSCDIIN